MTSGGLCGNRSVSMTLVHEKLYVCTYMSTYLYMSSRPFSAMSGPMMAIHVSLIPALQKRAMHNTPVGCMKCPSLHRLLWAHREPWRGNVFACDAPILSRPHLVFLHCEPFNFFLHFLTLFLFLCLRFWALSKALSEALSTSLATLLGVLPRLLSLGLD